MVLRSEMEHQGAVPKRPRRQNRAAQNTGLQRHLLLQRFFGSPPGRKNVHPRRHHLLAPPVRHRARRACGRPYRLRGARQPPHMDAAGSGRPHPYVQNHRGVHPAAPLRQPFARKLRIHPQHPQQPAQYGGLRHRRQPPHRLLQRYGRPRVSQCQARCDLLRGVLGQIRYLLLLSRDKTRRRGGVHHPA